MDLSNVPVVILCGGEGTRFREETHARPKPLIEIGSEPILLHIMRLYSAHGFRRFILCLGYRGLMIKEFFLDRELRLRDIKLQLGTGTRSYLGSQTEADWEIVLAETGHKTQTGARLKRIAQYIDTPHFMVTYGDGLSDVDLTALADFHLAHNAIGTVTGVSVSSQFGELVVEGTSVRSFAEKPKVKSLINGGFFMFNRSFLDYLADHDDCILERDPLEQLARDAQLRVFVHDGFWQCMDTFKDYRQLNDLAAAGNPPWLTRHQELSCESAA